MKGQIGQAIGYFIGVVILFPLVLYGYNKIFYSPREVTEEQISQYADNSIVLKDIVDDSHVSLEELHEDKYLGYHIETITHFISRRGGGGGIKNIMVTLTFLYDIKSTLIYW